MRNILSALTVIFFLCTIAFAQNSSTVTQTCDNYVAGVTENVSNTSDIILIRRKHIHYPYVHNDVDVDRLGGWNTLHLDQTNGASAAVYQDGVTNTAVVIQN